EAAGKHALVAGLNVPAAARLVPEDAPPALLPFRPLLAAKSLAVTVDLADDLHLSLRTEFAGEAAAKKAEQTLQALLTIGREMLPGVRRELEAQKELRGALPVLGQVETALRDAAPELKGSAVQLTLKVKADAAFAAATEAVLIQVEKAARRTQS